MRALEVMRRRLDAQAICPDDARGSRDSDDARGSGDRAALSRPASPSEVVARLGAVQAQDYLGALWAVGLRMVDGRERAVERALDEGSIVRTWPMRGTLHFVAAADARWMVELLGPRMVARAAGRMRSLGLDDATFTRARRTLVRALEGGKALTRPAAYLALERAKVAVSEQRGLHILWRLAHERLLCFGPRQGKQQTIVLFDEWVPPGKDMSRDEALAALAERYFTGHGPATVADFAWWTGLPLAEARRSVELARSLLEEDRAEGRAILFARSARSPPSPPAARLNAYLLPAFDELLVGFADRSATVDPLHARAVHAGGGILKPTVVVDGRVVGTWTRKLTRRGVAFSATWFAGKSPPARKLNAVAGAFRRYAAFLGVEPLPLDSEIP